MGGPRRFKNRYEAPKKLWEKDRIKEEKTLRTEYGLKNSREIWIAEAELKKYRREARRLLSIVEEERKKDSERIFSRLNRYGILGKSASLEDILSLDVKVVLERRLQTRVLRKGFARTPKQARQLIAHGFISIGDRIASTPGYLVTEEEDSRIKLCKPIEIEPKEVEKEEAEQKKEEKPKEPPKKEAKKEPEKKEEKEVKAA